MASNTAASVISATLTGATVDTAHLTAEVSRAVRVWNLSGAAALWVRASASSSLSDPTTGGDGCLVVPAGLYRTIDVGPVTGCYLKILGNGNAYVAELV